MSPQEILQLTRRDFLVNAARGVGGVAFASLLRADGLLAAHGTRNTQHASAPHPPLPPHFAPRARQCIFLFMEGGVSQIDLFDPKPKLISSMARKCLSR